MLWLAGRCTAKKLNLHRLAKSTTKGWWTASACSEPQGRTTIAPILTQGLSASIYRLIAGIKAKAAPVLRDSWSSWCSQWWRLATNASPTCRDSTRVHLLTRWPCSKLRTRSASNSYRTRTKLSQLSIRNQGRCSSCSNWYNSTQIEKGCQWCWGHNKQFSYSPKVPIPIYKKF